MKPDDLPPLREIIESFGLGAKKSLGQHFLLDLNITRKIARLSGLGPGETVIEVGPGPGGLTRALLETGAHVIAIERDARCIEALRMLNEAWPEKLTLIEGDALAMDEASLLTEHGVTGTVRLASNLPYNISTELLIKWLKASPRWWISLTLMFQKEVSDRIIAPPGNKTYGRLGIISQIASQPQKGFDLPARAFTPAPQVDSSVVHFDPVDALPCDLAVLEKITHAAFSQRRKMLRAALKPYFGNDTQNILLACDIVPTKRAEEISIEGFIRLANFKV